VCCDRCRRARAKVRSGRCAASHAIPLLYFAAVQPAPAVRISLPTCGARGTRTPGPLLANRRQHVHRRPFPQVTVPGRAPGPVQIRAGCCTFPLYSPAGTHRQVRQQSRNAAVPFRRGFGFLPPPAWLAASYRWPTRRWPPGPPGSSLAHPHMPGRAREPCRRPGASPGGGGRLAAPRSTVT
jgi:hypothetical protein